MEEHLIDIREAADFLGIGEKRVKELVDKGELPAYKIGGSFLRFKKSQLAVLKAELYDRAKREIRRQDNEPIRATQVSRFKDFLYFNDFYILSIVIIVIAVLLIVAT